MSDESTEFTPAPGPTIVLPPARSGVPCLACGRAEATHLSLTEAIDLHGYGRCRCLACLLTDQRRPVAVAPIG